MTERKASNKLRDKFSIFVRVHMRLAPRKERQYDIQIQVWWSDLGGSKTSSQVKHDEAMATIAAINCDAAEYLKNRIQRDGREVISLFLDLEQSL
ncbi:hypothetical protein BASA50_000586 [Batrachochytrium salamandrivorans]|uniref:Uncharacterized protein n=1 Tax=Batrachochytrium salamandrivorans TaxID=1357716 RepID=A0ABQ8EWJ0_9FUNG|nr:hypothetical protein BASA50_000586 [Batrachochytrium salamandrivorans]